VNEIAAFSDISVKTVEFHRCALMARLDIHTTAELTRYPPVVAQDLAIAPIADGRQLEVQVNGRTLKCKPDAGGRSLAARGNSKFRPGKRFQRRFRGVPKCPTMRQEGVVAPLCASAFRCRRRFSKALTITTGC
jgi:hypothetical protein